MSGMTHDERVAELLWSCMGYDELCELVVATEEENANLRELLTFYLGCLTKGHVNCDSCAIIGDGDCGHGRTVIDKARELGIEVKE